MSAWDFRRLLRKHRADLAFCCPMGAADPRTDKPRFGQFNPSFACAYPYRHGLVSIEYTHGVIDFYGDTFLEPGQETHKIRPDQVIQHLENIRE